MNHLLRDSAPARAAAIQSIATMSCCRREFLQQSLATAAAIALSSSTRVAAANAPSMRWPLMAFSKAFQDLNYEETADLVAEVGWDGIECPVRKGGQVLSERVEEDLPKMVEALTKRGRRLIQMTTDIRSVKDPFAEKILRTGSRLGIRHYRLGWSKYRRDRPIPDQLRELRAELKDLAALNRELGLCGGFQNHSGADYIGAPVWDIFEVIKELDPKNLGVCFDIAHATIEGGYAWPTHAQLMERHLSCVYVKDFAWEKTGTGWSAKWCPIGEGTIQRSFFDWLRKTAFSGPISLHVEHPVGTGRERVAAFRKDTATLRAWLEG